MAEITTVNIPQGDFVTSTLVGAITSSSTSFTIGSGLTLDANGGFLSIDYDSTLALGVDSGPETVAYTSYVTGTGVVSGVTRAQAATTAVAHANGATVQCGMSSKYLLNGNALGYAQITANFTSATTGSNVDITGMTVTVTVPAGGRRIKITAFATFITSTAVAGTAIDFIIKEGGTGLSTSEINLPVTSYECGAFVMAIPTAPSAGSHTYKVSFQTSAAGTFTLGASAVSPAFILVELI